MENLIIPRQFLQLKLFYSSEEYKLVDGQHVPQTRAPDLEEQINRWLADGKHQLGFVSAPTLNKLEHANGDICYVSSISVLYIPAEVSRDPQQPPPKKDPTSTAAVRAGVPPFGSLRVPGPQLVGANQSVVAAGRQVSAEAKAAARTDTASTAPGD